MSHSPELLFLSRPKAVRLVRVIPGHLMPDGVDVRPKRGGRPDLYEVYNPKHSTWTEVYAGDFVRVDLAPDDVYPITADYVAENHVELARDVIPDGSWVRLQRTGEVMGAASGAYAYDVYGESVNYTNYAGKPMPTWEQLPDAIAAAWERVAVAMCDVGIVVALGDRHTPARQVEGEG